jgi:hypothetical protein
MMRLFSLRTAGAAASAVVLAGILAGSGITLALDQTAATTKDVIFAHKILMDTIGRNMDESREDDRVGEV